MARVKPEKPNEGRSADEIEVIERQIRERAYLLWQREGRPAERADEYWNRARELIEAETYADYPPTQSRGYRT